VRDRELHKFLDRQAGGRVCWLRLLAHRLGTRALVLRLGISPSTLDARSGRTATFDIDRYADAHLQSELFAAAGLDETQKSHIGWLVAERSTRPARRRAA
jgi:hypothetical protein